MKILLIGHSIIDRFEGDEYNSPKPGGLFYSAMGTLSASHPDDRFFAVTSWNDDSKIIFGKVYSSIDLSYANKVEHMPEVILKISGEGEREETYKNLSAQLSFSEDLDWNSFDGILINMITGFDISLEQLKTIRKIYEGKIYFDVHTLSRGVGKNMKREFRPIPKVREWLSCVNIVQLNENELRTVVNLDDEYDCAQKILGFGPEILIITKGERGAQLYQKIGNSIKSFSVSPLKVQTVNKVGCGDIFGAVFFYSYISTNDVVHSLSTANKAGAITAATLDITNFSRLNLND